MTVVIPPMMGELEVIRELADRSRLGLPYFLVE